MWSDRARWFAELLGRRSDITQTPISYPRNGAIPACCFTARGQSTFGSISGTVKDASGAAIAGAQVTLTSTGTGAMQTFTTDQNGLLLLRQPESR